MVCYVLFFLSGCLIGWAIRGHMLRIYLKKVIQKSYMNRVNNHNDINTD